MVCSDVYWQYLSIHYIATVTSTSTVTAPPTTTVARPITINSTITMAEPIADPTIPGSCWQYDSDTNNYAFAECRSDCFYRWRHSWVCDMSTTLCSYHNCKSDCCNYVIYHNSSNSHCCYCAQETRQCRYKVRLARVLGAVFHRDGSTWKTCLDWL